MILLLLFLFFTSSCSIIYNAFIRNTTDSMAMVDVYLLNKEDMPTLPNKVKVANLVVPFKGNYRKYMDRFQNVIWVDTNHFTLEVSPKTTVDLTDMAGRFQNGSALYNVLVTITVGNRMDTIINGRDESQQFDSKGMGFRAPILYYDIK